jgi:hypothetical protein
MLAVCQSLVKGVFCFDLPLVAKAVCLVLRAPGAYEGGCFLQLSLANIFHRPNELVLAVCQFRARMWCLFFC